MRYRTLAVSVATAGIALSAAACSSSSSSTSAAAPASPTASASASASNASTTDFGSGCSAVPASGAGSFTGMATAPVATAASANPVLSTLVTAVKAELATWAPPVVVQPPPVPAPPVPTPTAPTGGLKVQTIDLTNANVVPVRAPGVVPLQRLLAITVDGVAGPHTKWALGRQQELHGVTRDYIFGVVTASAFLAK